MKNTILTATALFAALALASDADASEPAYSGHQVRVSYGDLNLSNPAGAKAMLNRLDRAAERACGNVPDSRNLAAMRAFRLCAKTALADAVNELGAPQVTALHAGQSQPRFVSSDIN